MATPGLFISVNDGTRFRCLASEFAKGRDDVHLTELYSTIGRQRLRIRLRSNAYKFQCYAIIEVWGNGQWQEVWTIQPPAMETKEGLCYAPHPSAVDFHADVHTLLTQASLILNIATKVS